MSSKLLLCNFLDNVFCSFRKSERSGVMNRCLTCPHYLRMLREMAEAEDVFFEEEARARERLRREKSLG